MIDEMAANNDVILGVLKDIQENVRDSQENLRIVASDMGSLNARVDNIESRLTSLTIHVLEGNGKPSLVSRVQRLETLEEIDADGNSVRELQLAKEESNRSKWEAIKAWGPYALSIAAILLQLLRGVQTVQVQQPSHPQASADTSDSTP